MIRHIIFVFFVLVFWSVLPSYTVIRMKRIDRYLAIENTYPIIPPTRVAGIAAESD